MTGERTYALVLDEWQYEQLVRAVESEISFNRDEAYRSARRDADYSRDRTINGDRLQLIVNQLKQQEHVS